MCTVTFFPHEAGYYVAMNRDEQLARLAGLPPQRRFIDDRSVLFPSEPSGGTWISLNDARVCFALINWYSVPARVTADGVSRGEVVKATSSSSNSDDADERITRLPLEAINPFRLIGIFPESSEVVEWRWDLKKLVRSTHEWAPRQWISSSYDEPRAQIIRSATFEKMRSDPAAGTLGWLRRLHCSHAPERGPSSTCMHRDGAGTVSYTEIISGIEEWGMNYRGGHPCVASPVSSCFFAELESAPQPL